MVERAPRRYRLRVYGYVFLWILEGVGQLGSLAWFLIQGRRVRRQMHRLILDSARSA